VQNYRATYQQELDINVYEAAKRRIKFCYENFDEVLINYSGGKDSMVVVLLAYEVMQELGITDKVKVVFYDEEFVYPETLEAVEAMFKLPFVEGYRLCIPMEYELTLPDGSEQSFRLWTPEGRTLLRPIPEGSLTTEKLYEMTEGEKAVADLIFNKPEDKGKRIVQLLGIRAQESITRRSTILQRAGSGIMCFLRKSKVLNIAMAAPIYDWVVEDVFYYIKNQDHLALNKLYFLQMIAKKPLRVTPPIHSKSRMNLEKIKVENPSFYEMLLRVFPSIDTTGRYVKSLSQYSSYDQTIEKHGLSIRGIKSYIVENISDELQLFALKALKQFIRDYMEFDRYRKYGFTYDEAVRVCFVDIMKGNYGKTIMLRNKRITEKKNAQEAKAA
jgi:predicted phosphoadenosine phosphosulfate sulfurtransferase